MDIEQLGGEILTAAFEVHRELGPGLFESTYERCLLHELNLRGIQAQQQAVLPLVYKGVKLKEGYRIDLLVEEKIILELKTVSEINNIHLAQILTYLKLSNCNLGFILNFNVRMMKDGIKRVVNKL